MAFSRSENKRVFSTEVTRVIRASCVAPTRHVQCYRSTLWLAALRGLHRHSEHRDRSIVRHPCAALVFMGSWIGRMTSCSEAACGLEAVYVYTDFFFSARTFPDSGIEAARFGG